MSDETENPRVLVLNDNEELLKLLKVLLSAHGFDVVTTTDESEALNLLREGGIDLFIQDLDRGPRTMGGHEVFRIIQEDPTTRDIPSICMTGSRVLPGGLATGLAELGVDGFLNVPFDSLKAIKYMRTVIERQPPETTEASLLSPCPSEDKGQETERMIREYLRWASHRRRSGK